jgi:hypothetical protein
MASAIFINFAKENFTKELHDLYIPLNSKFLIIKETDSPNYDIQDVYQISETYPKIYSKFGAWKNKKLEIFRKNFWSTRMDLKGFRFIVAETFVSFSEVKIIYQHFNYNFKSFSLKQ